MGVFRRYILSHFIIFAIFFHEVGHVIGFLVTGHVPDKFIISLKDVRGRVSVNYDIESTQDSLIISSSGPLASLQFASLYVVLTNILFKSFLFSGGLFHGLGSLISFLFVVANIIILQNCMPPRTGVLPNGDIYKTDGRMILDGIISMKKGKIRNFLARTLMYLNREHFKRNLNAIQK